MKIYTIFFAYFPIWIKMWPEILCGESAEDLEKSRVLKRKVSWNLISINPVFTFLLFYLIIKLCKLLMKGQMEYEKGRLPLTMNRDKEI
ncbi:hypothetical protein [Mordavella massiliensis]|uniref:hypothetical protein n=1 Tax=Mordavella massiliensis TaxID=1871024 RepID=UPI00210CA3C0|nr:hypothetical protein [Mordavella massiliensis]